MISSTFSFQESEAFVIFEDRMFDEDNVDLSSSSSSSEEEEDQEQQRLSPEDDPEKIIFGTQQFPHWQ